MPADPIDLARPEYRFAKDAERVHLDRATRRRLERRGWDFDTLSTQSAGSWVGRATVLHRTVPNPVAALDAHTSQDDVKKRPGDVPAGQACGVKTDCPTGHRRLTPTLRPLSPSAILSLQLLRSERTSVVIALDTEFYYPFGDDNIRRILSVQLAIIDPGGPDVVHEFVLLSLDGAVLPVERVVGYVIDRLGLPKALRGLGETKCPDSGYGFRDARVWTVPLHDTHGALWRYMWWFCWSEQVRRSDASSVEALRAHVANRTYAVTRRMLTDEPRPFWEYWEGRLPEVTEDDLWGPEAMSILV